MFEDGLSSGDGWTIVGDPDTKVTVGSDYSADGIPAPPGGGDTIGLTMEANLTNAAAVEVAVVRPLDFNGVPYRVTFDMWTEFSFAHVARAEFLSGYRIVAIAFNYAAGRGKSTFNVVRAASVSDYFVITETRKVADGVELAWEVEPGATYTVRRADELDGGWEMLPSGSDLGPDTDHYTGTASTGGTVFHQVVKTGR